MRVEPYVYFQGRCEEALEFYRGAVGADATVFARFEGKVAHAVMRIGDTVVLASDGQGAGQPETAPPAVVFVAPRGDPAYVRGGPADGC